jgi:hypothetical protein
VRRRRPARLSPASSWRPFRLKGRLLAAGDLSTDDLGPTSGRWQVLGAIEQRPLPVAESARNMGVTRQAAQRVADDPD